VAEVGEHRHELRGAITFAAWFGVHAALLASTRAKIEALVEWGWAYSGKSLGAAVLDGSEKTGRLENSSDVVAL
jgi:NADH dehydrogenase